MTPIKCDLLVIGAGSGGLSVAAGASQMGADVVLLESHDMGGDCLNSGCVPSKALLACAGRTHVLADAALAGGVDHLPPVDYGAAMDHVRDVIETIAPVDSQSRFEGLGVRVIRQRGRFIGRSEVAAGDTRITARRIVIATGSRPSVPPIQGLEDVAYLTNETLWALRQRPEHLIIVGGGAIGMEMAQAHLRLGCRVTVVEADRVLSREDPEAAALVTEQLRQDGADILEQTSATGLRQTADQITLTTGTGQQITGSHLLIAVGRRANVEDLGLEHAGVETTKTGIKVDARLRSTNPKVYAIGDVAGQGQFTHLAGYQASVILRSLLFALPARARADHIPRAIYTDPELAQVGLPEAEARQRYGARMEVARVDYSHNDRAITGGQTKGFIKVMVVRGRPVGATVVGHQAGELIATWSLAIANRLKMSQIAAMVAPYPTIAELNKRVAGAYFSPRLFESSVIKRGVRLVQDWIA
ncbi:dihydrolipoyl dehydrogenase family protein [Tritonibacter horizontis]|uniref:Mercuric reductase n=1 Tax=Tritonibacter horizontis TaxID=1768241 RepID=A0A132BUS7_9RHOB|nr:FAD-dependent oxidoreductase [Tritonibacter horizontis]KUP92135.1 mercuric reductase [Tritonibacter horizontis]